MKMLKQIYRSGNYQTVRAMLSLVSAKNDGCDATTSFGEIMLNWYRGTQSMLGKYPAHYYTAPTVSLNY